MHLGRVCLQRILKCPAERFGSVCSFLWFLFCISVSPLPSVCLGVCCCLLIGWLVMFFNRVRARGGVRSLPSVFSFNNKRKANVGKDLSGLQMAFHSLCLFNNHYHFRVGYYSKAAGLGLLKVNLTFSPNAFLYLEASQYLIY